MALVLADRIKETTTTTGTGTYTLAGAVTGFESFGTVGNGNTTYYCCTDGSDFEVGVGTYTSSGTTLARTTILQSSNSDNAVDWSAGTRDIFCTQPAEKAVFLNADGHIDGDLTIVSTDTGANPFPNLVLFRNSASPADNDDLGKIFFRGKNDADQDVDYHSILSEISDASDGTEDARLYFKGISGGSDVTYIQLKFGRVYLNRAVRFEDDLEITGGKGVEFQSSSDSTIETRVVADPSADRTITLPDATGTVQLTDGSGASLTSLNASELGSGTVPNARLDAQLQDVAGLAVTNGNFIVGDGSNFVAESGATARASMGVTIGTDVQAYDADLAAIAGLTSAADKGIQFTGSGTAATYDLTAAGKALLDDANASAQRTTLGLGTAAVAATGISNGNVPVFTSGVADDDFLRVNGTSIEGRSASEVASDIGAATTDDATALAIALG